LERKIKDFFKGFIQGKFKTDFVVQRTKEITIYIFYMVSAPTGAFFGGIPTAGAGVNS